MKTCTRFLWLLLTWLLCAPASAQTLAQDKQALIDLYNATGGPTWTSKANWITNPDVATWQGVSVFNGRVRQLTLSSNNLVGAIPPSFGSLSALVVLTVNNNQLTSLPESFGNLSALRFLYLFNNQLTSLPASMGSLAALEELQLSNNQLTSLPTSMGSLTALQILSLATNQLTSLPTSMGSLTALQNLDVQYNSLANLPASLGSLAALRNLNLHNNQLTTLPASLGSLAALRILNLSSNQLRILPSTIGSLSALTSLSLHNNQLTSLPSTIGSLSALQSLTLLRNQLTSLPASINNLAALQGTLFVSDNNLTFEHLEPYLSKLPAPDRYAPQAGVETGFVVATRTLSVTVGGTANLYQWKKNGTAIAGATASTLVLTAEQYAQGGSYQCLITSTLVPGLTLTSRAVAPQTLGQLAQDKQALIDLYNATGGPNWTNKTNWITNPDVSTWQGVTVTGGRVVQVDLVSNNLVGAIPSSIGSLSALQNLDLSDNPLTSVPESLGSLSNLQYLGLSLMQLTSLPTTMGNLSALQILSLEGNQLTSLPASMGSLSALQELGLAYNQLPSLPASLGSLGNLRWLSLAYNRFTFDQIEPYLSKLASPSYYAPQAEVETSFVAATRTLSMTVGGTANLYQWKKNGVVIAGATASSLILSAADLATSASYQCLITSTLLPGLTLTSKALTPPTQSLVPINPGQGVPPNSAQDLNYVTTNTILIEGKTSEAALNALSAEDLSQSTTYFDGLSRPVQQVTTQGSPTKKDLVQPIVYDALGREPNKYLPYAAGTDGRYKLQALPAQSSFYAPSNADAVSDGNRAVSAHAFAQTRFEASPLNRVLEQGAPGSAWQITNPTTPANNKTLKFEQRPNRQASADAAAAGDDNVRHFTYAFNADPTQFGAVSTSGFYAAGQLWVNQTTDEHNYQTLEFKDKENRMVLKKVQVSNQAPSSGYPFADQQYALTYYVYDDLGQLRLVIQPEGSALLPASGSYALSPTYNAVAFTQWCFTYHYDEQGRLSEKQLPGSGPVWMVYNKRDELILTQDARQRIGKQWSFSKYDALGRVVSTGLYVDPSATGRTRAQMQAAADLVSGQFETRTAVNYNLGNANSQWGYTLNGSFPALNLATDQLLTLQYYDDYNFDNSADNSRDRTPILESYSLGTLVPDYRTKGKPTATLVRKLGSSEAQPFLWTVSFYDKYGRVIQTQEDNHLGGRQISFTRYDFAGKVLRSELRHHVSNASAPQVNVLQRFEYDHAGRQLKVLQQHGNDALEKVVELSYNELGQVKQKKMGNLTSSSTFLQTVDYAYNIRGWLKTINAADPAATVPDKDLFGMELSYEQPEAGHTPQYNGNISSQRWVSRVDATPIARGFKYHYDPASRLTAAAYVSNARAESQPHLRENFSTDYIAYDRNGNLTRLKQYGLYDQLATGTRMEQHFRMIDDMRYSYQGNRLTTVEEQNTGTATAPSFNTSTKGLGGDFQNGVNQAEEYGYDASGNLQADANKGITSITYNHLNLPERIVLNAAGDSYLRFTYSATGVKLSKEVVEQGAAPVRTDYCGGGFVYQRGVLEFFPTAEGRAINPYFAANPSNTRYTYEYHYKDHLGNLRLSFRDPLPTAGLQATMEPHNAVKEELQFANLLSTRVTDGTAYAGSFSASKLNAAANKTLGPFKTLRVQKSDVVKVRVQTLYKSEVSSLLNWSWLPYLSLGSNVVGGSESGRNTTLLQAGLSVRPTVRPVSNNVPTAYVQYLFYDENYTFLRSEIQMVPLAARNAWQELVLPDLTANVDGYVQVLVANESNVDVYFDELAITYQPAIAVQENHYSPFGNNLVGIEKQGQPDHKFQFNGQEKNAELSLNWYTYRYREYDPQLARFTRIDPLTEKFYELTPYQFASNNPISKVELEGLEGVPFQPLFRAATAPQTQQYLRQANTAGKDIVGVKVSTQLLGGEVNMKAGGVGLNFGGALYPVEAQLTGNGIQVEANAMKGELKMGNANFTAGAEAKIGAYTIGTDGSTENKETGSLQPKANFTAGKVSGDAVSGDMELAGKIGPVGVGIKANYIKAGEYIDNTVKAVQSVFKELFTTFSNNSLLTDPTSGSQRDYIERRKDND